MRRRISVLLAMAVMLALMVGLSGAALAQPGGGGPDVCVSIKGDTKVDKGESGCRSDETSKAVAVNDSYANAIFGSDATAVNDSVAFASDNGDATAINDSYADASDNSDATAVNDSVAWARQDCVATAHNGEGEFCP